MGRAALGAALLLLVAGTAWAGDEETDAATETPSGDPDAEAGDEAPSETEESATEDSATDDAATEDSANEDSATDDAATETEEPPATDQAPADAPPVPPVPELPPLPPLPDLPPVPETPSGTILPSTPVAMPPPLEVKLRGFVGFDWQPYLKPMDGAVDAVAQLRVAPRLEARFQFLRALAEVEYRHDFIDPGRNRLIVREAKAGLRWKGLRVEGGALLERWGKMDVFSPTDNLVAFDYEDQFAPEPLPVPGFLVGYARGPLSGEFVLIPAFRPSRFRGASVSRWDITRFLPKTQEIPLPFDQVAVVDNRYVEFLPGVMDGDAELGRGIELGGRVDLTLPVLDVGLSFLYTRDRLPSYTAFTGLNSDDSDGDGQPDVLVEGVAEVQVEAHHRRLWVPGVDLAAVLGPVVLKGEAAFFATEDPGHDSCLIDDPYVKYAFGAELVLSNLVGDFDLAIRAQYNGDVTLPATDATGADRISENLHFPDGSDRGNHDRGCQAISFAADQDEVLPTDFATGYTGTPEQRHPFSHGFFWNVNFAFTRSLTLDLRGFVDVAGDALLMPRFSVLLLDRLDLSLGALVVLGTGDDTLFTPYADNHRVELGVRYAF